MFNEVNLLKDKFDVPGNYMAPTIPLMAKIIIVSVIILFGLILMISMESGDPKHYNR
jgi:hypothetical protein